MKIKVSLETSLWIVGVVIVFFFNQIDFDPTSFLQILLPILFGSSFVLLGVFAVTEVRKAIKEHYNRNTQNILKEIEELRLGQERQKLEDQIETDQKILLLRQSLKNFRRNYFESCVGRASILFAIALLSTFIDFGSYADIPNLIVMSIFSFWGLFYFIRMIQTIFVALNIVKID